MFQKSVVKDYLTTINADVEADAWTQFQMHLLNPAIQENIRNSKEEQYQSEFLISLFVKELKKKKVNLTLAEEAECGVYFIIVSTNTNILKTKILKTDQTVDQMIYDPNCFTEEEVAIVINS